MMPDGSWSVSLEMAQRRLVALLRELDAMEGAGRL